jgi:hypothetical protein
MREFGLAQCVFGFVWFRACVSMLFDRDDAAGRPTKQKASVTSHRYIPYHSHRQTFLILYTPHAHNMDCFLPLSLSTYFRLSGCVCCHNVAFNVAHTLTALLPIGKLQLYVSRRTLNCWFHSCTALASRLDFCSLTLISIWPTQNQLKPSKYSNCSADVKIWNYLLALCYGLKRECLFFTHDFCQKPAVFACCYAK